MKTSTHQLGRQNEAVAVRYLKRKGYRILELNCRTACGEIDIVAKDGPVTVFIEVKSRRSDRYGRAKSAVTPSKQARLSRAGLLWLKSRHQMRGRARFDVVAIDHTDEEPQIEFIQNAFELKYG